MHIAEIGDVKNLTEEIVNAHQDAGDILIADFDEDLGRKFKKDEWCYMINDSRIDPGRLDIRVSLS